MKVLTAAPFAYDGVEVGYCDCEPGEIVMLGQLCDCVGRASYDEDDGDEQEEDCPYEPGCDREPPFVGLVSLEGTTTARVEERDLDDRQLSDVFRDGLRRSGWLFSGLAEDVADVLVRIEVDRVCQVTAAFEPGALISIVAGVPFRVLGERGRHAVPRRR